MASAGELKAVNKNGKCYLLRLPAELRNRIYDFTFPTNHNKNNAAIDIFTAAGPSKALVLSCKQIYKEASAIHTTSFRSYWQNSTFVLNEDSAPSGQLINQVKDLGEANINQITACKVIHPVFEVSGFYTTEYHGQSGVWCSVLYRSADYRDGTSGSWMIFGVDEDGSVTMRGTTSEENATAVKVGVRAATVKEVLLKLCAPIVF